ncbi:NAD(P)H-binding protein [bacterium]|nr:NAD(P)H-binding protein [bacterium]
MRLIVTGGTGRLGRRVVMEALSRNHTVTILSRSPEAIDLAHPGLQRVSVNVRDQAALAEAVQGHDAVISTLGHRRAAEAPDLLSVGMANLIAAMEGAGIQRIVALASAGILQLDASRLRFERAGYPEAFRAGSQAHLKAWEHLEASALDWTLVCPPELVEGDREALLSVQADYLPEGPLKVSMEALARWMIDALPDASCSRKRVGILSPTP